MSSSGQGGSREGGLSLDHLPVAAVIVERGIVTSANGLALDLLAEPDLVGKPLSGLFVDEQDAIAALLARSEPNETAKVLARRLEPLTWLELSARAGDGRVVVTLVDVTEAVRAQRILSESSWSVTVAALDGQRLWGPVGRDHPREQPPSSHVVPADRVHPEDLTELTSAVSRAARRKGGYERIRARLRDHSRDHGWTLGTVEIINAIDVPEIGGMILRLVDRDEAEEVASIGATRSAFQSVAEAAPIGIVLTGPALNGVYFNEAIRRMLPGLGPGEGTRDWTAWVRAEDRAEIRDWVGGLLNDSDAGSRTVALETGSPEPLWALVTVAPRYDEDGLVMGYIVTFQDVTTEISARRALEAAQEHLLHMASHDPLTGLANRTVIADALERIREDGFGRHPAGMLFCDLDEFKGVNDRFGHETGDQVLVEIAGRLRHSARASDLVARLGGDEFLILAAAPGSELEALAERIAAAVAEPIVVQGHTIRVGVTIGTASADGAESLDGLLGRADAAMYRRKLARRR